MSKPLIFTITATWDSEANVWSGHCDDIPAAADAPTLDELMDRIGAMAIDLLPDNHPGVDPSSVFHLGFKPPQRGRQFRRPFLDGFLKGDEGATLSREPCAVLPKNDHAKRQRQPAREHDGRGCQWLKAAPV